MNGLLASWMRPVAGLGILAMVGVSLSGCFNAAQMVQTKKRTERVLESSSVEETVLPKSTSVALEYQFVEGELVVHATQKDPVSYTHLTLPTILRV